MDDLYHFRDPCVHCDTAMEDVLPGPCPGDASRAVPMAYCSLGVRWDGVEHFRVRFSDGRVEERHTHIGWRAPYYHFGHSRELTQPPRYDERLKTVDGPVTQA